MRKGRGADRCWGRRRDDPRAALRQRLQRRRLAQLHRRQRRQALHHRRVDDPRNGRREAADSGHAVSMAWLSECYRFGDGVEKDLEKDLECARESLKETHPPMPAGFVISIGYPLPLIGSPVNSSTR